MPNRVLAVLGTGLVDPATPLLRADDLGVVRGESVFETLLVRSGAVLLLSAHLERFARSAARLQIALPDPADWQDLIDTVLDAWPRETEGALRLVCSRGPEGGGDPVAWALLSPVPKEVARQRREGVRVVTRSLGVTADARAAAPWLLGGVKSTSYAVNMAATRSAQAEGADDAVLVSAEGLLLEGPTATLAWVQGDVLVTPPTDLGILPGTTIAELARRWRAAGREVQQRRAPGAALLAADEVALVSSVRGAVRVTRLDGQHLAPPGPSSLAALLGSPDLPNAVAGVPTAP